MKSSLLISSLLVNILGLSVVESKNFGKLNLTENSDTTGGELKISFRQKLDLCFPTNSLILTRTCPKWFYERYSVFHTALLGPQKFYISTDLTKSVFLSSVENMYNQIKISVKRSS